MFDIATFLQTALVLCSTLSDYTLAFDHWILSTSLPWTTAWDAPVTTQTWRSTLYACVLYAVLEPAWYWFMSSVSDVAMWWLLMGCMVHMSFGYPGCLSMLSEAVVQRKKDHEERCVPTMDQPATARYTDEKSSDTSTDDESRFTSDVENGEPQVAPEVRAVRQYDGCKKCPDHVMPWSFRCAPLLPIITAAASNAGLLFFSRYLSSQDSMKWQEGFKFGWCMITGLCLFCYPLSKWASRTMFQLVAQNRTTQIPETSPVWDERIRIVANLCMLIIVRAGIRVLLSQDVMALWTVDTTPSGSSLALESHLHIGRVASDPKGTSEEFQQHWFDRLMMKVPWWMSIVAPILNGIGIGLMVYGRHRQRRGE